jgi:REP element-mobilizing transposase RayT
MTRPGGRRSVRLKGYDYSQAGGYYVTIVTLGRECLFGEVVAAEMRLNALGRIADECWRAIPEHFPNVTLGEHIVMPNHVHGIIWIHDDLGGGTIYRAPTTLNRAPTPNRAPANRMDAFGKPTVGSLPTIVRSFKSSVTRRAGRESNTANIWQRNYHDHILRDQADYEHAGGYILDNPSQWEEDADHPAHPGNSRPVADPW